MSLSSARQRRPTAASPLTDDGYSKEAKERRRRTDGEEVEEGIRWFLPFLALGLLRHMSASSNLIHDCDEVFNYWEPLHFLLYRSGFQTWEYRFLYPIYPLICVAAASVIDSFPYFFHDKYANEQSIFEKIAKGLRPLILGFILCTSHSRTFSMLNGYGAPLQIYQHLEYHEDTGPGSILCVGSEWHRYPSSFFVPSYISEVRWIDDGFRGLLPFPFNETLGGTTAAPSYFNTKNKASDKQYLKDIGACNLLMELDLRRPYPSRGNDLSTWETLASLPFLDRELSPALYRSFFIPYQWEHKNVFGLYKLLRRLPTDQGQLKANSSGGHAAFASVS
ncbi:hypothetical protein CFC21_040612 [Triticum aestivum]|uniref:Mannosyltransferase n=1 Tax=Triticum aestivum TaxID=4565 RepID=A0A9R1FHF1_WHEAT|nr:hypothetical protein CFC21_040612 [Triticum aestivum]